MKFYVDVSVEVVPGTHVEQINDLTKDILGTDLYLDQEPTAVNQIASVSHTSYFMKKRR